MTGILLCLLIVSLVAPQLRRDVVRLAGSLLLDLLLAQFRGLLGGRFVRLLLALRGVNRRGDGARVGGLVVVGGGFRGIALRLVVVAVLRTLPVLLALFPAFLDVSTTLQPDADYEENDEDEDR